MDKYINLMVQQQMQCRQSMCQQRCRQMLILNCINTSKLIKALDNMTS